MNTWLADHEYLAGDYSIADMACVGWAKLWERQGQTIDDFPHVKRWLDAVLARPAVQRGIAVNAGDRRSNDMKDPAVQSVLFGQRAR
jgi:GST-like protein